MPFHQFSRKINHKEINTSMYDHEGYVNNPLLHCSMHKDHHSIALKGKAIDEKIKLARSPPNCYKHMDLRPNGYDYDPRMPEFRDERPTDDEQFAELLDESFYISI